MRMAKQSCKRIAAPVLLWVLLAVAAGAHAGDTFAGSAFSGSTTLSDDIFDGYTNTNTNYTGNALGGGLYFVGGTQRVTRLSVRDNHARLSVSSGLAAGGGMYVTDSDAEILDSVIAGNIASAGSNGKALGGGVFFDYGALTITDSAIVNNRVQGGEAAGSAIFVDMQAANGTLNGTTVLNLVASAGKTVEISGNVANGSTYTSGIQFGNAANQASRYNAEMKLSGAGDFIIHNPIGVQITNGKNFTLTKEAGSGNLSWDGHNYFSADNGTVTITLNDGVISLGDHFTLAGKDSFSDGTRTTTNMSVSLVNVKELTFSLSRDQDLALFDFTDVRGTSEFSATPKTRLTTTLGREVKSFHNRDYYIVKGLYDEDVDTSWFDFRVTDNEYTTQGIYDDGDGNLLARISYHSPFDVTRNSLNAQDALESLTKTGSYASQVSDDEFAAMVAHANNITAELFLEHGYTTLNATDRMARTAVDMGLRNAYRDRLSNATLSIGGEVDEDFGYYGYMNLADCDGVGLRMWGGYVGEWTNASARSGFNGYKVDRNGFILGGTRDFGDMAAVGVYGGYTYASVGGRRADAEIKSDMGHFGLMARFSPLGAVRELSLYGDAGYHYAANDSYRRLGGYDAKGSFHQSVYTIGGGVEYVWVRNNYNLVPRAEGRFMNIDQDRMTESGRSSTISSVTGYDKNHFITRIGIEATGEFMAGEMLVSPSVSLDWRHDYDNRQMSSRSSYINDPSSIMFDVVSRRVDKDSLDIGVGMTAYRTAGASSFAFNLGYNLNVSRNSDTHTLFAGIEVGF